MIDSRRREWEATLPLSPSLSPPACRSIFEERECLLLENFVHSPRRNPRSERADNRATRGKKKTPRTKCCRGPAPPRQRRPRGRDVFLSIAAQDAPRPQPALSGPEDRPWSGKGDGFCPARWWWCRRPCHRRKRRGGSGARLHRLLLHLSLRKSPAACRGRGACWEGASTTPRGASRT